MAKQIRYPQSIRWEYNKEEDRHEGEPSFDDDAYEQEVLVAYENQFSVSLGSFSLSGDAANFDESKACAERAFRALITLGNDLSQNPPSRGG